ncbi:hypothetical protein [Staphylococcus aureus]
MRLASSFAVELKEQAIQAIQRAQSISEITEQLEQFKAQMKAAN